MPDRSGLEQETTGRGSAPKRQQPRFLAIGRIARAHGVGGEVAVEVLTDFPERFAILETVYLGTNEDAQPFGLAGHRWHNERVLLTLEGITNRTEAERLRGCLVQIPLDEAMPLSDGFYYAHQLRGLTVVTGQGEILGQVTDFLETGANGVYVVGGQAGQVLLPAIPDVILRIDLDQGLIIVELPAGMT
jgi:16S rRNA processing protein RimM